MKTIRFLRLNWPYIIMLGFVLFVGLLVFMSREQGRPMEDVEKPYKMELLDAEQFKERQKAVEDLYYNNPPLYLFLFAFNLFILFIFVLGIVILGYLIVKWKRKEPFISRTLEQEHVKWDFRDVIKFAIMFYAFAYTFMLIQAALLERFPYLENRNFRLIFNTTIMDTAGIVFVLNFVIFIYRQHISSIGITLKNFIKNVFYGIAGYIAVIPLLVITMIITAVIISLLKYKPPVQPIVDVLLSEKKVPLLVYSSLFAAIAGPIMEEIFFRGFMYNAVKKHVGIFWSIILTASIFSFLHAHVVGFMPILILGILLTYLYEKTGSLIPSITVHIIHNLSSLLMVFLVKALNF